MTNAAPDLFDVTEIQQQIHTQLAATAERWAACARCRAAAVYLATTPISAPPAHTAWAISLWGWPTGRHLDQQPRPAPEARLDLSGVIPSPAESPHQAGGIAVLAALLTLRYLGEQGWSVPRLTLWGVPAAPRVIAPESALDRRIAQVRATLSWVVPPGALILTPQSDPAGEPAHQAVAQLARHTAQAWHPAESAGGPDYRLTFTIRAQDATTAGGAYHLQTRTGQARTATLTFSDLSHPQEAGYRLLITVLGDLVARIRAGGHAAQEFQLHIQTDDPVLPATLQARIAGGAAHGPAGATSARTFLTHFGRVAWVIVPPPALTLPLDDDPAPASAPTAPNLAPPTPPPTAH